MKTKNKKILYMLGSVVAIAPLSLSGMILSQKKDQNTSTQKVNVSLLDPYQFTNIGIDGVTALLSIPSSSNYHFFMGTTHGLFVSMNAQNWSRVSDFGNDLITSIISENGNIFVGTNGQGLWQSTNFGSNWDEIKSYGYWLYINAMISRATWLFLGTSNNGLWEGDVGSGGLTLERFDLPGSGRYINITTLAMVNGHLVVGVANQGLFTGINGESYHRFATGIENDWKINAIVEGIDGSVRNTFIGTEGHGLFMSTDGVHFNQVVSIPANFSIKSLSTTLGNNLLVGTEHHGLLKSNNYSATAFTQVAGGLGSDWDINYISDDSDLYVSTNHGTWFGTRV